MPDSPHILIIMTDQQRGDALGCAGNDRILTPHMDRLAAEGVRFHGVTSSAVCMPARASFISGMFPHQTGIWRNSGSLPADDETFFQHLQAAGYRTAHIGKSHYYPHGTGDHLSNHESYMQERGFHYVHEVTGPRATRVCDSAMTDHWAAKGLLDAFREDYKERGSDWEFNVWASPLPPEEHPDGYVGERAAEWIRDVRHDGPTCMFVGFPGPHEPWDAPEPYASMYDPADMAPPVMSEPDEPWLPENVRQMVSAKRFADVPPEKFAAIRANYYGKISLIDHYVGQIIAAYEERGWWDDTLVVFFSDHGEMAGDHSLLYKQVPYRGASDVPFIVRGPGVAQGAVADVFAQPTDIFPTLDALIGCDTPSRVAGHSLWPTLRDPSVLPDGEFANTAFMEVHTRNERITMVQTVSHKYVVGEDGTGRYLFDLRVDPDECTNLVGHPDYVDVEAALRDTILRWLVATQKVA